MVGILGKKNKYMIQVLQDGREETEQEMRLKKNKENRSRQKHKTTHQ